MFFQTVIDQICRISRVLSSPHDTAHCVIVAEGCPGRAPIIACLAAYMAKYNLFKISPSPIASTHKYTLETFKSDLVTGYTQAGVKVVIILRDLY